MSNIPVVPPKSNSIIAKADSGASRHYCREQDKHVMSNIRPESGNSVTLPNDDVIQTSETGHLPMTGLSKNATKVQVLPNLHSSSLISIGQLCDDNCDVLFNKHRFTAIKNNRIIMQGPRNLQDGLWDVHIHASETTNKNKNNISDTYISHNNRINIIVQKNTPISELIQFYQGCLFSPTKSTMLQAARNDHFINWPGLTPENINKYYVKTPYVSKGHMNQERQGLQSTKNNNTNNLSKAEEDFLQHNDLQPNDEKLIRPTHETISVITSFQQKSQAFTDQTGRFPYISSRGNQYVMITYNYDTNSIHAEPLQNRQAATLKTAFCKIHDDLTNHGAAPKAYMLDNECSEELKTALRKYKVTYELAPPYIHRRNAAERAIQTFKNHFIAGLSSTNPNFPVSEWDRLLPQATLTLNLLRKSRINPKLSAHTAIYGQFSFNRTPLAPPGTKIIIHEKPDKRQSWASHGTDAWYIGPTTEHYRCIKAYVPETHAERISDTTDFFPHDIPIPKINQSDYLRKAANDILSILKSKSPVLPFLSNNDKLEHAIESTAKILARATTQPQSTEKINHVQSPRVKIKKVSFNKNLKEYIPIPRVEKGPRTTTTRTTDGTNFKDLATKAILASLIFEPKINHIYNNFGKKQGIDDLLNGPDKETWKKAVSNELGRLTKGNDAGVNYTDTMRWIKKKEIPKNKKVTYANFTFDHRPLKSETHRCRLVVGGDKLEYEYDASSPAASLLETKLMINSTISDAKDGARFMTCDLKDFFLCSDMDEPEYMRIHYRHITDDIKTKYNLQELVEDDGYVYVKKIRGMYGLKQAAILAYKQLVNVMKEDGYSPIPHTIGLWKHDTRKTKFCLCVDDFGVKYFGEEDKKHLLTTLKKHYKVSIDHEGHNYCGLTINWNYKDGYVDIGMPGYIDDLLKKLGYKRRKLQYAPHEYNIPVYGQKVQFVQDPDRTDKCDKKETTKVQSIVGSLLYYSRAIDSTMLPALNEVSISQSSPTKKVLEKCYRLLDYASTYPDTQIRYFASDMVLWAESDAAYLVLPNAKSRIAGYFYLSTFPNNKPPAIPIPQPNGPLLIICKTLKNVVASAAESETGGLFINTQETIPIRYVLHQLEHKQPATPMKTDNSTAFSFTTSNIRQKRSKSWDMRYYWLREKQVQNQMRFYWDKGSKNDADYYTKHHSPDHHLKNRRKFVLNLMISKALTHWRGCVDTRVSPGGDTPDTSSSVSCHSRLPTLIIHSIAHK